MMNHSIVEVVFRVKAQLQYGEEVRLSGNVPALGSYDLSRTIPLVTSTKDYPLWHIKEGIFLPGAKGSVRYKYCVFSGGKFSRWEGSPGFERVLDCEKIDQSVKTTADVYGHHETFSQEGQAVGASPVVSTSTNQEGFHAVKAKSFAEWNKKSTFDSSLVANDGVIIVSYFLPVVLSKSSEGHWSAAWDEENILSLKLPLRASWVGSVRYNGNAIPVEDEVDVAYALAELNCHPVFLSQIVHHQFYDIFCKQNLWLLMHLISDVYGPVDTMEIGAKSEQVLWQNYTKVNNQFREKVVEVYHSGDLVWIHGFHLMLLPSGIRRKLQQARIGYFFHTPFPSSEIWKTVIRRDDLLRGILSADHIGFHLFEYARHFLTSCHRLLGYSYDHNASGIMTVRIDGREVAISCIHIGADIARVSKILDSPNFADEVNSWLSKYSDRVIVSGIDKLERLKGIPAKLFAIRQFMTENPEWVGKITFVMIGVSAFERGCDYSRTIHDVNLIVDDLNKTFGSGEDKLIYFEERAEKDISLRDRLSLFAASDILLIIPPRDGLNRLPLEFTLAKQKVNELREKKNGPMILGHQSKGLVILSEFISAARVMRGAIIVNPWRSIEVKIALKYALTLSPFEVNDRVRRNLEFSTRLTTESWANQVLQDLKSIPRSDDPNDQQGFGFGTKYRVLGVRAGFQTLNIIEVNKAYRCARQRLILLDWGGTLVAENEKSERQQTFNVNQRLSLGLDETDNSKLKATLELLCSDPKNYVFVVSGKSVKKISDLLADVKGLGLAAEHGCYYRWPKSDASSESTPGKWQTMVTVGDQSWKDAAKKLMDIYTKRTHGTHIEQKGNSLIWQFRDADPEFGYIQSKELEENLREILSGYSVDILRGGGQSNGYIEVRLAGLSKGLFLAHIQNVLQSINTPADFILAVGDDITDEPMFEEIARYQNSSDITGFSVTVGKKPTAALSYLNDITGVEELLESLNRNIARDKGFYSSHDLPSQAKEDLTNVDMKMTSGSSKLPRSASSIDTYKDFQTTTFRSGNRTVPTSLNPAPIVTNEPFKRIDSNANISMNDYFSGFNKHFEDDNDEVGLEI